MPNSRMRSQTLSPLFQLTSRPELYANLKGQARIDNWRAFPNKRAPLYLIGTVSYHTRQRQFQSSTQETSSIVKYDFQAGWVETQNTIYTLGREASDASKMLKGRELKT